MNKQKKINECYLYFLVDGILRFFSYNRVIKCKIAGGYVIPNFNVTIYHTKVSWIGTSASIQLG